MFEAIQKLRAHERIVVQIEEGIASGALVPGDRFPSERELSEQFDLSRPTVREGLRVAESFGLIEVRPGNPNGSIVTAHYPKGFSRVMEGMLRGKRADLGHLVELRMLLEGQASQAAAERKDEAALGRMRSALEDMRQSKDIADLEVADVAFHQVQGEASSNPLIALMMEAMRDTIRMSIKVGLPSLGWPEARETAVARHSEILSAIEAGDGTGACRIARSNLMSTYVPLLPESADRLRSLVEQSGSQTSPDIPRS